MMAKIIQPRPPRDGRGDGAEMTGGGGETGGCPPGDENELSIANPKLARETASDKRIVLTQRGCLNLNQGTILIFGHNRFVFSLVLWLIHRPRLIDLTAVLRRRIFFSQKPLE
ncbi:MAG TPA: hypothetical protein VMH87_05455 [Pseudomonadales bacterium]|nr:hypothetical protein [Pseudomonadales bacterium]